MTADEKKELNANAWRSRLTAGELFFEQDALIKMLTLSIQLPPSFLAREKGEGQEAVKRTSLVSNVRDIRC